MQTSHQSEKPTSSRWIVAALVIVYASALIPFATVHAGPRAVITAVAAGIGFGVLCLECARRRPSRLLLRLSLIAGGCLVLMCAALLPLGPSGRALLQPGFADVVTRSLSIAGVDSHPIALKPREALAAIGFTASCLLLAGGTAMAVHRRRYGAALARWLVCAALGVCAIAAAHRLGGASSIWWGSGVPSFSREPFFAPFVNPNHAGIALATALPMALALSTRQRGSERLIWLPAAALLGLAIWLTGSRGGVLCGVVGMGVLAALAGQTAIRKATAYGTGLLIALTAVLGPRSIGDALARWMTPYGYRQDTWGQRPEIWRDTLDLIAASPLIGAGAGSYEDAFKPFKSIESYSTVHHAHQDWLQIAAENGLLVLAGWICMTGLLLYATAQATLKARRQRSIPAAFTAAATALTVGMFFDFPLRIGALGVLAALIGGACAGLASRRLESASYPETRWFQRGAGVVLFLALAPLLVQHFTRGSDETIWSDIGTQYQRGRLALERAVVGKTAEARSAGLEIAEDAARQALRVRPLDHQSLHLLASVAEARGETDLALTTLELAADAYPTLPGTWLRLARNYRLAENPQAAQDAWRRLLQCDLPNGDKPQAIFEEIIAGESDPIATLAAVIPERADRLRDAGLFWATLGEAQAAAPYLHQAAQMEPRMGAALGAFLLRQGAHEEALDAVKNLGDNCVVARVAGEALVHLEKYDSALERLQVAQTKCDRRDRRVQLAVARAHIETDRGTGQRLLERLLRRDPSFHEARRVLLRAYRSQERRTRMLPHLEQLVLEGEATPKESAELIQLLSLQSWTDGKHDAAPEPSDPTRAER